MIAAIFVKTTPLFRAARDRCWCVHWLPQLTSISKPSLSTGSNFFIFNRFPRGHYLVLWVRVSLGVRVRVSVRVSNLLGSV